MHYIQENDPDELKKLKIATKNLNFLMDVPENDLDKRLSPLILASALGRQECVKMILDNPTTDVDLPSEEAGYTPLATACITGNYDIVRMLLEKDPEVNRPNRYSQTPFVLAFNRLSMDTNIFENKKIAFKMADLLLLHGADINWIVEKSEGHTLLMQLCAMGKEMSAFESEMNLEAIKFLIERGANKDIKSIKNKSCAELAEKNPNYETILSLLKATSAPTTTSKTTHRRARSISIDKSKIQKDLDKQRNAVFAMKK